MVVGACVAVTALNLIFSRASRSDDQQSRFTIRVNVNEVLLQATVTDHKNKVVSGLSRGDFEVYENGLAQKIAYFSFEDTPVTVGLVVDHSGSMRDKRSEVFAGARALLRLSNPQDEIFAVNFNENVSFGLPKDLPFTNKSGELEDALSCTPFAGETALYDAIAAALAHLQRGSHDRKVLIVISDGGDNASKLTWSTVKALVARAQATIYTIGTFDDEDSDQNPRVLKELAKQSGGQAFFPKDLTEIVPVCQHIAHNIRNQYTIGYIPIDRETSERYRTIEVKAKAKNRGRLFVRTRTGYFPHSSTE
jgi:Ca-activated chloride channel homolog